MRNQEMLFSSMIWKTIKIISSDYSKTIQVLDNKYLDNIQIFWHCHLVLQNKLKFCRVIVSVGAVGAVVPTDFEKTDFVLLMFGQKCLLSSVFLSKYENMYPRF